MGQGNRRAFLAAMVSAAAASACRSGTDRQAFAGEAKPVKPASEIPKRRLGATGQVVSVIGLGGFHIGKPEETLAVRIMHRAIDEGMTFFDNCWDYHRGESERRMGRALQGRRDKVFLMTKLDGRTKESATQQLEDSLRRLRTDTIDLVQIHEVIRPEDPNWVFGTLGAVEVLQRAKEQGKLRYIGFTGHKDPKFHMAMLDKAKNEGFRFDAVQMPLNVMDAHYDSFEKNVLPRLQRDGIGVLGMKPLGSGDLLRSGQVSPVECLTYALSLPTSVVITGCESMRDLEQALTTARGFQPLSGRERQTLLAKTEEAARAGRYEKYKTSRKYDGTVRNPHWLSTSRP